MKLEQSFSDFLKNTVNLNKTRVDVAESGIGIITNFLKANDLFESAFVGTVPQGSFRQETIIKPVKPEQDFDVDLLFEVRVIEGWEPRDYLEKLSAEFKNTERYKNLVDTRGKERCVTIDYESDFHIDVVPAIKDGDAYQIMNRVTNQFEPTDGDGYAEWFDSKNKVTGNKYLTKVTRLIKYIRDTHESFEVKSILLTTLLGNQIYASDDRDLHYCDLPTSLITVLSRLDAFLQANQSMPLVSNPVLVSENFNRKWNQAKYSKFREKIHEITIIAVDAYNDEDETRSLTKWKKIFGDKFVLLVEKTASPEVASVVFKVGESATTLGDYSHREPPPWPFKKQGSVKIKECAVLGGPTLGSNGWPIPDGCNLNYIAEISEISEPYEVWWQVVNTGEHAASVGQSGLRGKFEKPKDTQRPLQQRESSLYTGKHWIQCFIVRNGCLLAESTPFFINVVNKTRKKFRKQ